MTIIYCYTYLVLYLIFAHFQTDLKTEHFTIINV